MGDLNQLNFVKTNKGHFQGPFLEIGSKDYGSTPDLRTLFPGEEYIGVDLSPGKGVDLVLDFTTTFDEISAALKGKRFGTIFCLSVLEHCEQPFFMAENLTKLLQDSGKLCISVPFVWRFHGYPSDYWRFTPEGVKKLFPGLAFEGQSASVSTCIPGEISALNDTVGQRKIPKKWSGNIELLKIFGKLGFLKWPLSCLYKMSPTNINMIGVRKSA